MIRFKIWLELITFLFVVNIGIANPSHNLTNHNIGIANPSHNLTNHNIGIANSSHSNINQRVANQNVAPQGGPQIFTVTNTLDDGTGILTGTLSYAIRQALPDQTIRFELTEGNVISVTGQLPAVRDGTKIEAPCDTGPSIVISGTSAPIGTNGLILTNNTAVTGLKIVGFSGRQIVANAGSNRLTCVIASKN